MEALVYLKTSSSRSFYDFIEVAIVICCFLLAVYCVFPSRILLFLNASSKSFYDVIEMEIVISYFLVDDTYGTWLSDSTSSKAL